MPIYIDPINNVGSNLIRQISGLSEKNGGLPLLQLKYLGVFFWFKRAFAEDIMLGKAFTLKSHSNFSSYLHINN